MLADVLVNDASITDIVITHMHADHIGGSTKGASPRFPNAALHIAKAEWEFWTDPSRAGSMPKLLDAPIL
ncbi:MAG: MBL fold metallo-hydrolase [Pseudomonadota bacterium]